VKIDSLIIGGGIVALFICQGGLRFIEGWDAKKKECDATWSKLINADGSLKASGKVTLPQTCAELLLKTDKSKCTGGKYPCVVDDIKNINSEVVAYLKDIKEVCPSNALPCAYCKKLNTGTKGKACCQTDHPSWDTKTSKCVKKTVTKTCKDYNTGKTDCEQANCVWDAKTTPKCSDKKKPCKDHGDDDDACKAAKCNWDPKATPKCSELCAGKAQEACKTSTDCDWLNTKKCVKKCKKHTDETASTKAKCNRNETTDKCSNPTQVCGFFESESQLSKQCEASVGKISAALGVLLAFIIALMKMLN